MPDIIVAAVTGLSTGWCVGPLIPICGRWLAKSSILQFLVHLTILTMAVSSQLFPYSRDAPKRVVFQHTFLTAGSKATKLKFNRKNYFQKFINNSSLIDYII